MYGTWPGGFGLDLDIGTGLQAAECQRVQFMGPQENLKKNLQSPGHRAIMLKHAGMLELADRHD